MHSTLGNDSDNGQSGPVARLIKERIEAALSPKTLVIQDDSASHAGHAGHKHEGESHFSLTIMAKAFQNESRINREKMVHRALGDLLPDRIHALKLTLSPTE
ncbi:BolA family protein [Zymomonas mobilis]